VKTAYPFGFGLSYTQFRSSEDIRQTATFAKPREEKVQTVSTSIGPARFSAAVYSGPPQEEDGLATIQQQATTGVRKR